MKKIAIILVAAATLATVAFAQRPVQGRPGNNLSDEERIERRVERMKTRLELSDSQAKELKKIFTAQTAERKKMQEDYRKAMAKHREKCQKDLAGVLTPEQKAKYDSLLVNFSQRQRQNNDNFRRENGCRYYNNGCGKSNNGCRYHDNGCNGCRRHDNCKYNNGCRRDNGCRYYDNCRKGNNGCRGCNNR